MGQQLCRNPTVVALTSMLKRALALPVRCQYGLIVLYASIETSRGLHIRQVDMRKCPHAVNGISRHGKPTLQIPNDKAIAEISESKPSSLNFTGNDIDHDFCARERLWPQLVRE